MLKDKKKKKKVDEVHDDLKIENNTQIQRNIRDNSIKKPKKIKAQGENNFLKKKQSELQAEKIGRIAEEKDDKYKFFLHDKQEKQVLEEQKKHDIKTQVITEKKKFEERVILRKEAEKRLRIKTLKKETKKMIEKEQMWRNQVNQEFARKMEYTINLNKQEFCLIQIMENNTTESLTGTVKKRLTQYTRNVLIAKKQYDQIFDPGNIIKQMIKRELNHSK